MPATRRRLLWLLPLVVVIAAASFLLLRGRGESARYATVAVGRGDIVDVVGATGVLQAVITVQVGSQVSGTIAELHADFNSTVKKGQVVARLEPSSFRARVNQAAANLATARANVDRSQAAIDDSRQKYERAQELAKQSLLPESDLETARATYQSAVAQHQANRAAVKQAEAGLNQAQVDLDHTVISAPVDGVVLARNVDIGQTVAASFQAPVLFVIANDLSRMQVNASIDEADIGRVRVGQEVTFTVDAFPEQSFRGRVEQIRLQPVTAQNVVTYNTIITVDNSQLKLMPGMTATVSVVVRKAQNALRFPASALRFRPEGFEPRAGARAAGGRPGAGAETAGSAAGGARGAGRRQGGDAGAGAGAEGGGGRTRAAQAGGGSAVGVPGGGAPGGGAPGGGAAGGGRSGDARSGGARPGLVFVLGPDGQPKPTRVRLGVSDGRFVEVLEGLEEGALVITGTEEPGTRPAASPGATTNPFQPGRFQPRNR